MANLRSPDTSADVTEIIFPATLGSLTSRRISDVSSFTDSFTLSLLYRAISLLPDAQKEAVTLFYFSGLSVQSISEITGKSETNTKVLLCRAREKLRKILEEEQ